MKREKLKQYLKERGLTQKEVADMSEIDEINFSRILTGKVVNVREATVISLSKGLGIEPAEVRELLGATPRLGGEGRVNQIAIPFLRSVKTNSAMSDMDIALSSSETFPFYITDPTEEQVEKHKAGNLVACRCQTSVMEPELLPQDILVIVTEKPKALGRTNNIFLLKVGHVRQGRSKSDLKKASSSRSYNLRRIEMDLTSGMLVESANRIDPKEIDPKEVEGLVAGYILTVIRDYPAL